MSESPRPSFSFSSIRELLERIRRRVPWPPPKPSIVRPPVSRPGEDDVAAERRRVQVEVIRTAFRKAFGDDAVAAAGPDGRRRPEDDADALYLYRPGYALVRDNTEERRDFDEFVEFFERRDKFFEGLPERDRVPTPGLVLVRMPARSDEGDSVLDTLDEIDRQRAERGIEEPLAQPDHILYVTAKGHLCPAIEPELPRNSTGPVPVRTSDESAGAEVRVAVVDTGWWKDAAAHPATPWVSDVTADPADEEHLVGTTIHEYAGHGTFVAGVVKCLAPRARVEVEGALTRGGAIYESEICEQLQEALHDDDLPQIVSISAGTHTRKSMGLLGFEILAATKGFDDGVKTIVVAAAGNDESDDEFYPAAYPWVIGVGSVDPDGKRSKFSNYGRWVKAYARGRDLVNAFPRGTYTCHYPENKDPVTGAPDVRQFDGLARWSGTSFATPVVAGAIAAHMSATGNLTEPGRAWDELRQAAPAGPDGTPLVGPL